MAQTVALPVQQVPRDAVTSATRHLCAGAYLDREFRNTVISQVRHDCRHRVAPSYGFDLTALVHHAWRAWLLETGGQTLTAFMLGIAATLDPGTVVTAACGAGIWILGRTALRDLPEVALLRVRLVSARWLRRQQRVGDHSRHRELSRRVALSAIGCVVLAVIGGVAATSHGSLAGGILSAALLLGLLLAISAGVAAARQQAVNHVHDPAGWVRPGRLRGRLAVIAEQESSEWVVYRRPRPERSAGRQTWRAREPADFLAGRAQEPELDEPEPFTGSGKLVHRWLPPLSIQLLRPGDGNMQEREYATAPFTALELVEHIKAEMKPVGDAGDPLRLRGFAVTDRFYIAETDLPDNRRFLTRPPGASELATLINDAHGAARHHLEIQVTANGEVVTTVFLRVTVRGKTLSLDFAACALTPTPHGYRLPDEYAEVGLGAILRAVGRGIADLPQVLADLWRLALAPWVVVRATWATQDRTLAPRRRRPPGTRFSVREVTPEDWNSSEPDKRLSVYNEMKIIEQRILTVTEDFLYSHGVEITAFTSRSSVIINSGVLNMGSLEMHNSAAGAGAQANNNSAGPGTGPGDAQPPQEPAR